MKAFKTILVGVGATFTIDCFTFIISLFGNSPRGILFVGRWMAYMPQGKFLHHTVIETPAIANELIIGHVAHYCIGITFAFLLVKMFGENWLSKPTFHPALIIAIISLIFPQQPQIYLFLPHKPYYIIPRILFLSILLHFLQNHV